MTQARRRGLNGVVTRMWSLLAPAYEPAGVAAMGVPSYRPPHDEVIAQLRSHGSRNIADIACGTGILSDRIQREPLLQAPSAGRWKPQHNASPAEMRALFDAARFTCDMSQFSCAPVPTRLWPRSSGPRCWGKTVSLSVTDIPVFRQQLGEPMPGTTAATASAPANAGLVSRPLAG